MKKFLLITLFSVSTCIANAQSCLKTADGAMELKISKAGNNSKDRFVLFKGTSQKIKLKFIKENPKVCNECTHTEVITYYNEMLRGKFTGGKYVLTYKEGKYEMTYTRTSDEKNYVFSGSGKPEHCTW